MMKLLVPLVMALAGLGAGVGAAIALRPPPEAATADPRDAASAEVALEGAAPEVKPAIPAAQAKKGGTDKGELAGTEFVEMSNQLVIPLIHADRVASLVVLTVGLEVPAGTSEAVMKGEPKLRDLFLRVLLDHANTGGFDGAFTANGAMQALRRALLESARGQFGDAVADVLIMEINRQDG